MTVGKLLNDATSSTKGTIYQLYIALQKCFELGRGEKIIIERYGDVTVAGSQQLEIKQFEAPLTDSHINFWKTLKNWMEDAFDETAYQYLVLLTTQKFGSKSRLQDWNTLPLNKRLLLVQQIYKSRQVRGNGKAKPSEVRVIQRRVLAKSRRNKLSNVLKRLVIADNADDMNGIYQQLKARAHGIPQAKQGEYIDALYGFITRPAMEKSWEITYETFAAKTEELSYYYHSTKKQFPVKYLADGPVASDQLASEKDRLFVKKLEEIEHHEVLPEAIRDYIYASQTVRNEFASYEVLISSHRQFADEVINLFGVRYRHACRNMIDCIRDSKNFYDEAVTATPPQFPGFELPRTEFRNGVLHMLIDDPEKKLKWRLTQK